MEHITEIIQGTSHGGLNQERSFRKALAMVIIFDEQPFSIVESEAFKNICRHLQPQFSILSRRMVARDCLQIFADEKSKLKALLKSVCSRVSLTINCWTSLQNLNYLTIIAHYIDNDWKEQKCVICFSLIANHEGETVDRKIEEEKFKWMKFRTLDELHTKVEHAIVMILAVNLLQRRQMAVIDFCKI